MDDLHFYPLASHRSFTSLYKKEAPELFVAPGQVIANMALASELYPNCNRASEELLRDIIH
jgi:hypothetical protein